MTNTTAFDDDTTFDCLDIDAKPANTSVTLPRVANTYYSWIDEDREEIDKLAALNIYEDYDQFLSDDSAQLTLPRPIITKVPRPISGVNPFRTAKACRNRAIEFVQRALYKRHQLATA